MSVSPAIEVQSENEVNPKNINSPLSLGTQQAPINYQVGF